MGVIRIHDLTDTVVVHHDKDEYQQRIESFRAALRHLFMTVGVPSVQLRSGHEMPLFGLGTW